LNRRLRQALVVLAGALSLSGLSAAAGEGAPVLLLQGNLVSFNQPISGLRPASISTQARVAVAFGEPAAGLECGTPRLLAMRAAPGSNRTELVADPPSLLDRQTWITADGRVAVHYSQLRGSPDAIPSADINLNGLPDYLEAVGAGLSRSLALAERTGFQVALPRSGRLDVYLANLGGTVSSYTVPSASVSGADAGAAFIVIDTKLHGDDALLRAVAAHQAAHALLIAYDPSEPAWWHEASAAVMEMLSEGSAIRYVDRIEQLLSNTERGLQLAAHPAMVSPTDGVLWASYMVESSGGRADILRRIWEDLSAVPGNNLLEATDLALRSQGRTLAGAFAEFTTWSLFTGERDDGLHFSFADLLQTPRYSSTHRIYPATGSPSSETIAPLGWSVIRFESDGSSGGVTLNFEGEAPGDWEADLLLPSRRNPLKLRRVPLAIDGSGRASVSVPWNGSAELLLLVRNQRLVGPGAAYSYSAVSAPGFPYEVGSLSAEPDTDHVRLVWDTESEDGLYGWEVYRSEGRGPFVRVNDVTIPAVGSPDDPVTYQFVDATVREGILYKYYVLGITNDGLLQRSFIVATRLPR
jgi:hypothetical protein